MYKQIPKLLINLLIIISAIQIKFVSSTNCMTWTFLFQSKTIDCVPGVEECCGWIFKESCCSIMEKNQSEELRNVICRIIVFVIVIGIILIFIAFLIGWIYSCYLIAKQIQETPGDNETTTETNGHSSLVYSFFTRYINTISITNHRPPNSNEVFSLPINDKPPSYNSLFKPGTNILIQQNNLAANSNQSLSSSTNCSSYQQQIVPRLQNSSTNANSNGSYVIDDLPPYPGV